MAIEYDQRDSQRLFEEKLKQEAKEKEANMARKKQKIPGPIPNGKTYSYGDETTQNLDLGMRQMVAANQLRYFHAFNILNQRLVKHIGQFFQVDAEAICKHEGITYDIV